MTYSISSLVNTMEINGVTNVVVTDIFQDEEQGDYYRDVNLFAVPEGGTTAIVVVSLRMRAATTDAIEFDVPASTF